MGMNRFNNGNDHVVMHGSGSRSGRLEEVLRLRGL